MSGASDASESVSPHRSKTNPNWFAHSSKANSWFTCMPLLKGKTRICRFGNPWCLDYFFNLR